MSKYFASILIQLILYGLYFGGLLLLQLDNIILIFRRFRLRHRLTVKEKEGVLSKSCSLLFETAFGKTIDGKWVIIVEIVIFISVFFVVNKSFIFVISLLFSIISAAFPIAVMYSKSMEKQAKCSFEGISIVSELYRQYRMGNLNIFEAIERTVAGEGEYPISRRLLYILLIRLRDSSSKSEIKENCRRFGRSLGSIWGRMLASCIEASAVSGRDISAALLDLVDQLKTAKIQAEERKRLNSEAVRMTVFLVPILYFATVLISTKYLNLPVKQFLFNQLLTREGFLFLMINIFLFMLNIIILNLVSSIKMDL